MCSSIHMLEPMHILCIACHKYLHLVVGHIYRPMFQVLMDERKDGTLQFHCIIGSKSRCCRWNLEEKNQKKFKEMSIYVPTLLINAKICHTSPVHAEMIVLQLHSRFIIEVNALISSSVYPNIKSIIKWIQGWWTTYSLSVLASSRLSHSSSGRPA